MFSCLKKGIEITFYIYQYMINSLYVHVLQLLLSLNKDKTERFLPLDFPVYFTVKTMIIVLKSSSKSVNI